MELFLDILVTLAAIASLGLAAWSGRGHFYSEKVPRGSIIIGIVVLVTTGTYLFLVWSMTQPTVPEAIGFVLQCLGIGLFVLTIRASRAARLRMAFDEGNPRGLVTDGPYRYVRHPFYVSYIVYFTGFAVATWAWIAVLPLLIVLIIYVLAARMEEGKFANTPMSAEYQAYRQRTGFFFPKLGA